MNKEIKTEKVAVKRKMFTGTVVSSKTPQTVIVSVMSTHRHPLYKKTVRRSRRFAVHNPELTLAVGDMVTIGAIKPVSKTKSFIVVSKIS